MSSTNNLDKFAPQNAPRLFAPRKAQQPTSSLSDQLAQRQASSQPAINPAFNSTMPGSAPTGFGAAASSTTPFNFNFSSPMGAQSNQALPENVVELNKQISELKKERDAARAQIHVGERKFSQIKKEATKFIDDLKAQNRRQLEELREQVREANDETELSLNQNRLDDDEITELKEELAELRDQVNQFDSPPTDEAELRRELQTKNELLTASRQAYDAKDEELDHAREQWSNNAIEKEELEAKLREMKKEAQLISQQRDKYHNEANDLRDRIEQAKPHEQWSNNATEKEELEAKLREMKKEAQLISQQRDQYHNEATDLRDRIEQAKPRILELEGHSRQVEELVRRNNEYQQQILEAKSMFDSAVQQEVEARLAATVIPTIVPNNFLEGRIASLEVEASSREAAVVDLEARLESAISGRNDAIMEKDRAIEHANAQDLCHAIDQDAASTDLSASKVKLSAAEALTRRLRSDNESLRQDLAKAVDSSSESEREATSLRVALDSARSDLLTVQGELTSLRVDLEGARSDLLTAQVELKSAGESIGDMSQKLESAAECLTRKEDELATEQREHNATKGMHLAAVSRTVELSRTLEAKVSDGKELPAPIPDTKSVVKYRHEGEAEELALQTSGSRSRNPTPLPARRSVSELRAIRARLFGSQAEDEAFEAHSRREWRRLDVRLSLSTIVTQEIQPVDPVVLTENTASDNVSTGIQTFGEPDAEVKDRVVAVRVERTKSARKTSSSGSRLLILFLFMLLVSLLARFTQVAPVAPGPIALIEGHAAAMTPAPVWPTPLADSLVDTVATASVEVPTSTEIAAIPEFHYLPEVFYYFRMPSFGDSIIASALGYWKYVESIVVHRLANLFARGG